MSSSEQQNMRRRIIAGGLLAATLVLAGCGFRPLYRQDAAGGGTVPQMAAITIPPPPDRLHQLLRNELLDRLNPTGAPARSLYTLTLKIAESRGSVLVTRTESISRFNLIESVEYRLFNSASGEVLDSGTLTTTASYNVLRAEYANLAAEEDARTRATRDLAELLRGRLALFFERNAS